MFIHYDMPRKAVTPEEKEAISTICYKYSLCDKQRNTYCCTRNFGHKGNHIAGGLVYIYAEWNDEE